MVSAIGKRTLLLLAMFTIATLGGCVNGPIDPPVVGLRVTHVAIEHTQFLPTEVTIKTGEAVSWSNQDDIPHGVLTYRPDRSIQSGPLNHGETFTHTFDQPGEYRYQDSIHPDLTGTVNVTGR